MVSVPGNPVTFAGGFARAMQGSRAASIQEERNRLLSEQAEQAAQQQRFEQRREFIGDILGGFDELVKNANDDPLFGRSEVPSRLFADLSTSVDQMTQSKALDPDEVAVIDRKRREAAERLAFMRSRPTPLQQEIAEAERIVGAPLTPEQVATKLGLDPKGSLAQAATFINQKRNEEGLPPLTSRQLENMHRAEQAGLSFSVSPDGTISVTQGAPLEAGAAPSAPAVAGATSDTGDGAPGILPSGLRIGGETADEIRAGISVMEQGNRLIDHLIRQGQENPEIFGLTGTVRGAKQRVTGLAKDAASGGLAFLGLDAQSGFEWVNSLIDQETDADPKVRENLRPSNPGELAVFEKILQYSTARAMQPEGKLLATTVEAAAVMTKLTGFRSSREVMDSLQALKINNDAAINEQRRRFQQGLTGQTTVPSTPPVGQSGPETRTDLPTFSSPSDPGFADLPSGAKFLDADGDERTKR